MDYPKMLIASDGSSTLVVLDDVLIGKGINKLEFSTEDINGAQHATIKMIDVDVESVELRRVDGVLENLFETMKMAAPEK